MLSHIGLFPLWNSALKRVQIRQRSSLCQLNIDMLDVEISSISRHAWLTPTHRDHRVGCGGILCCFNTNTRILISLSLDVSFRSNHVFCSVWYSYIRGARASLHEVLDQQSNIGQSHRAQSTTGILISFARRFPRRSSSSHRTSWLYEPAFAMSRHLHRYMCVPK